MAVDHLSRVTLVEELGVVFAEAINSLHLIFSEPFYTLAVFPETPFDLVILGDYILTEAMLFSFVPVAFVAPGVRPSVNTKAMLLVVLVLALVLPAIVPDINSHAFHVVV